MLHDFFRKLDDDLCWLSKIVVWGNDSGSVKKKITHTHAHNSNDFSRPYLVTGGTSSPMLALASNGKVKEGYELD